MKRLFKTGLWWKLASLTILLVVAGGIYWNYRDILTRETITEFGKGIPVGWFLLAFLVLPLVGFPMSLLLLVAGVRFGFGGGMLVAGVGILIHHWIAYRIANGWMREKISKVLARWDYEVPEVKSSHQRWFTIGFAALHGPPYWAKIYLLAVTNIPFSTYFWFGAPVYILFCAIPVSAGNAATSASMTWVYVLAGISVATIVLVWWIRRRTERLKDEASPSSQNSTMPDYE